MTQSETAFIVGSQGRYEIRWFTPKVEMELCGHATLASAFVVYKFLEQNLEQLMFVSRVHGELSVYKPEFCLRELLRAVICRNL